MSNMTLDDVFDYLASDAKANLTATAFVTVTSGALAGVYSMDLRLTDTPASAPGVQAVPHTVEAVYGFYILAVFRFSNESLSMRITRTTPKVLVGQAKGSFHVEVDHNFNHFGKVTTNRVVAFAVDLKHHAGPCQSKASFSSLETPVSLVQCCIP